MESKHANIDLKTIIEFSDKIKGRVERIFFLCIIQTAFI